MQENPELPIAPMVEGTIPGDEFAYWLGTLGSAQIDEYIVCESQDWMAFKSDGNVFDVLEHYLSDEEFEKLPETESECRAYYDTLPWTKAIIVYINAPE